LTKQSQNFADIPDQEKLQKMFTKSCQIAEFRAVQMSAYLLRKCCEIAKYCLLNFTYKNRSRYSQEIAFQDVFKIGGPKWQRQVA